MQYTSNQHKSIQDFYIYTHKRSISLISSIIGNIRYTLQGLTGLCPTVRIVRTCIYFTESYYDKHTNTTEIRPDYYIYPLERSICLMFSIIINIRYVSRCVIQIYKLNSIKLCMYFHPNIAFTSALIKRPLSNCPAERRACQMAMPASPAHHARVVMTTSSDTS